MITIITGPCNCGKTRWLEQRATPDDGGFVQKKAITEGRITGYDLVSLASRSRIPFLRRPDATTPGWIEEDRIGRYSLSRQGLAAAGAIIESDLAAGRTRIIIDEIGRLELDNRGFRALFQDLLRRDVNLLVAVRDTFLDAVLGRFDLPEANIVRISPTEGRFTAR